jgi:septal ring factor EnvC (AmiA/AmiB activator)
MIKIISRKKYRQMVKDLKELQSAHLNLHELYKGVINKSKYEKGQLEDTLAEREKEIKELKKSLRKAEHERNELRNKVKKAGL